MRKSAQNSPVRTSSPGKSHYSSQPTIINGRSNSTAATSDGPGLMRKGTLVAQNFSLSEKKHNQELDRFHRIMLQEKERKEYSDQKLNSINHSLSSHVNTREARMKQKADRAY